MIVFVFQGIVKDNLTVAHNLWSISYGPFNYDSLHYDSCIVGGPDSCQIPLFLHHRNMTIEINFIYKRIIIMDKNEHVFVMQAVFIDVLVSSKCF